MEIHSIAHFDNERAILLPSSLPKSPFPRPSPQGPPEARPSPILRRMSSTSQSRAAPRSAVLWAARAGCRGALGALQEPWARRGRRRGVLGGAPEGAAPLVARIGIPNGILARTPLEPSSTTHPQIPLALGAHARLGGGARARQGASGQGLGRRSTTKAEAGHARPTGYHRTRQGDGGWERGKLEDARCVAYNTASWHRPADDRGSTRRTTGRRKPAYG